MRMEFTHLLDIVGDEPVFETGLLLAGAVDSKDVRRQLSRWTKAGHLCQLRRGLYTLAPPFQKVKPHPFVVANHMMCSSYVSLQSALGHYGLIPDVVPMTTSVTTGRPNQWQTPLGVYTFRHIKTELFSGYRLIDLGGNQQAFVAAPEKALLDLVHLQPGGDAPQYLQELRLQNLEALDLERLQHQAELASSPKLMRAVACVIELTQAEREYETL
jgi:predicted transcriptional regulator of viral defense system